MAKAKMTRLNKIWADRALPVKLKIKLVKTLVWPILSYGAEGWTLKTSDEKYIEAAEMWFWRRMLRISYRDHRTNASIFKQLGTAPLLLHHIRKRKLSFYGHQCREGGCDLTKAVLQGSMEGNRHRGRPRTQYVNNITKWTGLSMQELNNATRDRRLWRAISNGSAEVQQ